ncbi:hypothetical protein [Pasteuria penetrans]|uniref:hypothetical protein n=1 Tax=Pasteuria penetrans TaxID=86005 RepID=UPI000FA08693|nr:hypothetical protein [Pasteuria penetrans]
MHGRLEPLAKKGRNQSQGQLRTSCTKSDQPIVDDGTLTMGAKGPARLDGDSKTGIF